MPNLDSGPHPDSGPHSLKSLVAFELKVGPFEPEYAGKMDFYLNLLNDRERSPDDQPSIGVILCAGKEDIEVEDCVDFFGIRLVPEGGLALTSHKPR